MKTATVHAQQRWEYHCLTRRTENYLAKELNDLGQNGWELTSTVFAKDPKGENAWIAFLKRPYLGHAPKAVGESGEHGSSQSSEEGETAEDRLAKGFPTEGEEFEIHED